MSPRGADCYMAEAKTLKREAIKKDKSFSDVCLAGVREANEHFSDPNIRENINECNSRMVDMNENFTNWEIELLTEDAISGDESGEVGNEIVSFTNMSSCGVDYKKLESELDRIQYEPQMVGR